jgi:hypothetical protein
MDTKTNFSKSPSRRYDQVVPFLSSFAASLRASSTANLRMCAVTARPAARARCDNRSTSCAMLSAFVAGSCRQNSTSLAMTPTHATTLHLLKFAPNDLTSQTLTAPALRIASSRLTPECWPFLAISHPCSVFDWELIASRPYGNNRCARLDGRCCAPSVGARLMRLTTAEDPIASAGGSFLQRLSSRRSC